MSRLNGKKIIAWLLAALLAMTVGTVSFAEADEVDGLDIGEAVFELQLEEELIPTSDVDVVEEEDSELVTINFVNARGELIEVVKLSVGEEIKPLAKDPARRGYIFAYWYDADAAVAEPFDFDGPAYAEADLTLKARFTKVVVEEITEEAAEEVEDESALQDDEDVAEETKETEVGSEFDLREGDEATEAQPVYMTVNAGGYEVVNLRAESSMDCKILAQLAGGTVVEVIGEEGLWFHVAYNDIIGYIRMDLLDAIEEPEAEAIDERSDLSEAVVNVWMTYEEGVTQAGELVTMYCEVINIYGWEYSIHWQWKDADGDWADIEGASGDSYSFNFSEDDRGCARRPIVSVITFE